MERGADGPEVSSGAVRLLTRLGLLVVTGALLAACSSTSATSQAPATGTGATSSARLLSSIGDRVVTGGNPFASALAAWIGSLGGSKPQSLADVASEFATAFQQAQEQVDAATWPASSQAAVKAIDASTPAIVNDLGQVKDLTTTSFASWAQTFAGDLNDWASAMDQLRGQFGVPNLPNLSSVASLAS